MSATEERLLSLEDVANRLQVSDQSVRRWIKAGKLAAYKPGLEWRIRPSDLEDFLQAHSYPKVQAPLPESAEERRVVTGSAHLRATGSLKATGRTIRIATPVLADILRRAARGEISEDEAMDEVLAAGTAA